MKQEPYEVKQLNKIESEKENLIKNIESKVFALTKKMTEKKDILNKNLREEINIIMTTIFTTVSNKEKFASGILELLRYY